MNLVLDILTAAQAVSTSVAPMQLTAQVLPLAKVAFALATVR